ncbi:MAG: ROK family protein [Candidatus Hinthialibacter antarcticus]|nr:ROK family protein [Candidatus Hinthialibacter antarcticus]
MSLALGIEIGGTKLQAGVGLNNDRLLALARKQIDPEQGAAGIRKALPGLVDEALANAKRSIDDIVGVGIGFGGPVDSKQGLTLVSHQIDGWENFALQQWAEEQWKRPARIQNDASLAGYAEAILGAGRGSERVFYITVGSGVGGGWICNGVLDEGQGLGSAEIGHTWAPDPDDGEPEKIEHICSGWSMEERACAALADGEESILREMSNGDADQLTARMIYQAAEKDDLLAQTLLDHTTTTLAVAIGNVITLLHPHKIILGGGVSLMGPLFWEPLRKKVKRYAFHLYADSAELVPAELGEDVVVVGASLLGLDAAKAVR